MTLQKWIKDRAMKENKVLTLPNHSYWKRNKDYTLIIL